MNWIIDRTENGQSLFWHNGQTGGYNSYIGIYKDTQKGVFIISNSTINIEELAIILMDDMN